jgi:predicted DNA-binding protein (UPF0251 family)
MADPSAPKTTEPAPPSALELEAEADRLLWQQGQSRPQDLEYSFYREANLTRALRREGWRCEPPPPVPVGPASPLAQLLEALLSEACLGYRHRRVLSLVRHGLSHKEIAATMGVRRTTVQRWHQQALARLREYLAQQTGAETAENLRQAYREQLGAGAHHRECHCLPGREACRRDGLCKYRWYLFREARAEG